MDDAPQNIGDIQSYLFVDHRNVAIGARDWYAMHISKFQRIDTDSRIRLDTSKLVTTVAEMLNVTFANVHVSAGKSEYEARANSRKTFMELISGHGFEVFCNENGSDDQSNGDLNLYATVTVCKEKRGHLVLLTGHEDFIPLIRYALSKEWMVTVIAWRHSISTYILDLQMQYNADQFKVYYIDERREEFCITDCIWWGKASANFLWFAVHLDRELSDDKSSENLISKFVPIIQAPVLYKWKTLSRDNGASIRTYMLIHVTRATMPKDFYNENKGKLHEICKQFFSSDTTVKFYNILSLDDYMKEDPVLRESRIKFRNMLVDPVSVSKTVCRFNEHCRFGLSCIRLHKPRDIQHFMIKGTGRGGRPFQTFECITGRSRKNWLDDASRKPCKFNDTCKNGLQCPFQHSDGYILRCFQAFHNLQA